MDTEPQAGVVDLSQLRFSELPQHEGDPQLEAMLERVLRQVQQAGEAVSGFGSAI